MSFWTCPISNQWNKLCVHEICLSCRTPRSILRWRRQRKATVQFVPDTVTVNVKLSCTLTYKKTLSFYCACVEVFAEVVSSNICWRAYSKEHSTLKLLFDWRAQNWYLTKNLLWTSNVSVSFTHLKSWERMNVSSMYSKMQTLKSQEVNAIN